MEKRLGKLETKKEKMKQFIEKLKVDHKLDVEKARTKGVEETKPQVKQLEDQVQRLVEENSNLKNSSDSSYKVKSSEIREIIEKLSTMILSKNDFSLSDKQKYMIKQLLGDFATKKYKSKITDLTKQVELEQEDRNETQALFK